MTQFHGVCGSIHSVANQTSTTITIRAAHVPQLVALVDATAASASNIFGGIRGIVYSAHADTLVLLHARTAICVQLAVIIRTIVGRAAIHTALVMWLCCRVRSRADSWVVLGFRLEATATIQSTFTFCAVLKGILYGQTTGEDKGGRIVPHFGVIPRLPHALAAVIIKHARCVQKRRPPRPATGACKATNLWTLKRLWNANIFTLHTLWLRILCTS